MLYKPHIQPCMTWYVCVLHVPDKVQKRKAETGLSCLINTVHTIGRTPIMLSP